MRRHTSVAIGLVKSLEDPKRQGRVKVEFPWTSGLESGWASIAAPLAGKDRGLWFMPEEKDEVLLAFDHGNLEHPYIVGFLWNGVDTPPDTDPKHRLLRTPGGHELRFEDNDDTKKVVLITHGKHTIELDDAGKTVTIKTAGGLELVLNDNAPASATLTAGGRSITLKNNQVQIS